MRTTILFFFLLSAISANTVASGTKNVSLNMSETSTGANSTTLIYFATGTSGTFTSPEDVKQVVGTQQSLYSISADGISCSSNGFGNLTASVVISLGYLTLQAGSYVFSASPGSGIESGSVILLEDRTLHTFTNLLQQSDTVQLPQGQNNSRFYLHISAVPVLTTISAGCDNKDGIINVNQDGTIRWASVLLFDTTNTIIQSVHDTTGIVNFNNVPSGKYYVAFFTPTGYFFVNVAEVASHHIELSISASAIKADVGQTIEFYSEANNATTYSWDFGDSTIITGVANPSYDFFQEGSYNVTLQVTNDFQCSAIAHITMPVGAQIATSVNALASDGIKVYSSKKSIVIANNNLAAANTICEVYNLSGQMLVRTPVTSANFAISMEGQSDGIYLVQMKTINGNFTQKLFVTNN